MSERTMLVDASGNRYLFDAVFSSLHALNVKITDHPVQTGAAVADHAFIEPETVFACNRHVRRDDGGGNDCGRQSEPLGQRLPIPAGNSAFQEPVDAGNAAIYL